MYVLAQHTQVWIIGDDCAAMVGMNDWQGNRNVRRKTAPVMRLIAGLWHGNITVSDVKLQVI
jgi:hypothetical protein